MLEMIVLIMVYEEGYRIISCDIHDSVRSFMFVYDRNTISMLGIIYGLK